MTVHSPSRRDLLRSLLAGLGTLAGGGCARYTLPFVAENQPAVAAASTLPGLADSTRFAVIGDMGTGDARQADIGRVMAETHAHFPFAFALTVGDNLYGGEEPDDYQRKFVRPYKALLDRGVTFHASLGNHDEPDQRLSPWFHMDGHRYYTFTHGPLQFFALDSTDMTDAQVAWIERALAASTAPWKVAYFHHPLYSSGRRHGPSRDLRRILEPIFVATGVQVVFSGHEHFYERLDPQRGIQYFISGAGGQLRRGNIARSTQTAAGFDRDNSFMVVEATADTMWFESISRAGLVVDSGHVPAGRRRDAPTSVALPRAPVFARGEASAS